MARQRSWETYTATYRAKEMKILAAWIAAGESGSVVGLAGCGRSTLLTVLCHRPDVLQTYLPAETDPVVLIPIDLNNLPVNDPSTLYRTLLRGFFQIRDYFAVVDPELPQTIATLYLENRAIQDAFLTQSALHDLLSSFQSSQVQVVMVLNRFDRFCQIATPPMITSLRGLRDSFKDTLSYIVGMRQAVGYLPDASILGDMYDLLDRQVCWVGAMAPSDAEYMLKLDTMIHAAATPPSPTEVAAMLDLSGCFPDLIKVVGNWWLTNPNRPISVEAWLEPLLEESNVQYRLERLWNGLTQEEQLALSELQKLQFQLPQAETDGYPEIRPRQLGNMFQTLATQHRAALNQLAFKGLCHQTDAGWRITGKLLAVYVAGIEGRVRGKIWLEEQTNTLFQGEEPIRELTALEFEILRFLVENPRIKHTRDEVIDNAWPEKDQREGITPNALQVHIRNIRKKIESTPSKPRYLITWHGNPGGYQFFPEGKPT